VEADSQDERELRAARNQSMFRSVNEKLREINETFANATEEYVIACECADINCVQTLSIRGDEYMAIRANPRHFAVLHGHVYLDVEKVVRETDSYVAVEKTAKAAEVAEELAE
jgi:5-bromo-4-chloroindolyl phosphate hydrolysis protein